ncbi:uncharacterized protein LOC142787042 isoform X2 [Rhipicephalus microplus]
MQMQRIIKPFVCVFTIAPLLSGGWTSSEVIPDMTKFLNTSDPIWSYMTTSMRRDYDCKVDVIDSIQNTNVIFRRFFGYRKVIISDWMLFLNGRLYYESARHRTNNPIYNAMNVSFRAHGNPLDNEKLTYQSVNNTCGIFEVTDLAHAGHGITYELRVKNSSIKTAAETDCFKVYEKMGHKAKVTYLPDCQDILIGMNNILPGGSPDNGAIGLLYLLYPYVLAPVSLFEHLL